MFVFLSCLLSIISHLFLLITCFPLILICVPPPSTFHSPTHSPASSRFLPPSTSSPPSPPPIPPSHLHPSPFPGVSLHTFHGNFFVRSTDLLSLPNTNPDHSYTMNIAIDESLKDQSTICFQAALLYTSHRGVCGRRGVWYGCVF